MLERLKDKVKRDPLGAYLLGVMGFGLFVVAWHVAYVIVLLMRAAGL